MLKRLTIALIISALFCLFAAWRAASAGAAATLLASGDVDSNFDAGAITTQFAPTFVNAIAVQPDGKILVGGIFDAVNGTERQGLARLNADGSLDASFNPALTTPTVKALALQPDGKVLVGGGFSINAIPSVRMIMRLNVDGSLDTTFNLVPSQTSDSVSSIAVEPDGNILIGGHFFFIGNTQTNGLARLNQNGSVNAGLGFVATLGNSLAGNLDIKAIALQPDGKIVVGGEFLTPNVPAVNNLARLNTNGALDFAFGNPQTNAPVDTLAIQPDGRILIGGAFSNVNGTTRPRIARLNVDGSVEAAFLPALSGGEIISLLLQPDGKILIGGSLTSISGSPRRNIARLNADASLDSFYPAGTPGGANGAVRTIALQSDGKVLIGGEFTNVGGFVRSYVARLLADSAPPNSPPDAVDDQTATPEDTSLTINVLANDTDPDGDILTISSFTQPVNGSVTNNGDGTLTYTPPLNYNGNALFTYTVSDASGATDSASVFINVTPVNDPPIARDDVAATEKGVSVPIGVLANDTDVEGETLGVLSVTQPAHGTATAPSQPNGAVSYSSNADFTGEDSFTYVVRDASGGTSSATVRITVRTPNHAPTANDDNYVLEDASLTVSAPGILANDTDADGDPLTARLVTGPLHGSLTLNADGSFTYVPAANFTGCDSFDYDVWDGRGGVFALRDKATVMITSSPAGDPLASFADASKPNEPTADSDGPDSGDNFISRLGKGTTIAPLTLPGISAASPAWSKTTNLSSPRSFHTATLLQDGKVLVVGGTSNAVQSFFTGRVFLKTAEIYDPATRTWRRTGDLSAARGHHTATLLPNGKVLVVGGVGQNGVLLKTAEVFNPATGTWTLTQGNLNVARAGHTATLVPVSINSPTGKVLVVGGVSNGLSVLDSAELYDQATGLWTRTSNLTTRRWAHTATYLPNGKVLVAGGYGVSGSLVLNTAELYDPATNTWTRTSGNLSAARGHHTATLLQDSSKVLFAGGLGAKGVLNTTELYDLLTGTFTPTSGRLNTGRWLHSATLLRSGKVLVAGGNGDNSFGLFVTNTAELYDAATETWTGTGSLNTGRGLHTATLLFDNKVLAAGGVRGGTTLNTAELYDPVDSRRLLSTCAGVTVAATHGEGFHGNSRIARIENGRVPCMNSETGEMSECLFSTTGVSAGLMWVEASDGQYAKTGQAITPNGEPGGEWIVAARVNSDGTVPCVASSGQNVPTPSQLSFGDSFSTNDTIGGVTPGEEFGTTCIMEDLGQTYNAASWMFGWTPLYNYATLEVCTSSNPHPDWNATLTRTINSCLGTVYCYRETAAGLNDINGTERDAFGNYLPASFGLFTGDPPPGVHRFCHMIRNGGYEVPAAKRPATRSLPAPGSVNVNTPIFWRPVNANVRVAN